jgi:tRNA pseudouridine55 synthase
VTVLVKSFEILSLMNDGAEFRCEVAAGTYVRSLAHELGQRMGTGAHLASLKRTRAGEFCVAGAVPLEELVNPGLGDAMSDNRYYIKYILNPRHFLLELPSVTAPEDQIGRLSHGNAVNLPEFSSAKLVKVFSGPVELAAIAQRIAGTLFQPKVVLL